MQFSDKFNNGLKIISDCGCDNIKSFLFILHKFVMHVTNKQFSDKSDNLITAEKTTKKLINLLRNY